MSSLLNYAQAGLLSLGLLFSGAATTGAANSAGNSSPETQQLEVQANSKLPQDDVVIEYNGRNIYRYKKYSDDTFANCFILMPNRTVIRFSQKDLEQVEKSYYKITKIKLTLKDVYPGTKAGDYLDGLINRDKKLNAEPADTFSASPTYTPL